MTVRWTLRWDDPIAAGQTAVALLAAGALAGALARTGPLAAAGAAAGPPVVGGALLAAALAAAAWAARRGEGPLGPRLVVALVGGALTGVLWGALPAAGALGLGLVLGVVVPEGRPSAARALPIAAGVLAAGLAAGLLEQARVVTGGTPAGGALLALVLAAGAAAAHALTQASGAPDRPRGPSLEEALALADAEGAAVLRAAIEARARCAAVLCDAPAGRGEAARGRGLSARAGLLLDEVAAAVAEAGKLALAGVEAATAPASQLAGYDELARARARVGEALAARRRALLDAAARAAARIEELSLASLERAHGVEPRDEPGAWRVRPDRTAA